MIFKKPSIKGQLSPSTAQASSALCIHSIKSFVSLYIIGAGVGGRGWLQRLRSQHPAPQLFPGEGPRGLVIDPSLEEGGGYGKLTGERGQGSQVLELSGVLKSCPTDRHNISFPSLTN